MAQRRHGAEYDEDKELVGRRGWRLGIWAAVAAVALTSAGVAAYTDVGAHQQNRTATARADQGHPLGTELEARRLSDAVRLLAADRDRLALRVNALERNLGDMTGSITPGGNRLAASPGPYAASPVPAPGSPTPTGAAPGTPPATIPPVAAPAKPGQPLVPSPVATGQVPDPAATVSPDPGPTGSIATRTDFGIDLGGAPSIEGLRALWTQIKAGNEAVLDGLRPVMNIRDSSKPGALELRLVAGPLSNAGAAARLCAVLSAAVLTCQATVFDGQRLALK
jgi:hypothetical protein